MQRTTPVSDQDWAELLHQAKLEAKQAMLGDIATHFQLPDR
jgi:hypothetical protein